MKKKRRRVLLILDIVLAFALVSGILVFQKIADFRERAAVSQEELNRRFGQTITYHDEDCALKPGLSTVLLIGTDVSTDDGLPAEAAAAYNQKVADFLVVLVIDHRAGTVTPFQICRDTVCEVPWLSRDGKVGGTERMQISRAFSFGTGKRDSCINTRNAVEKLLFGVPIDNFLAVGMEEAIPLANDLVGGVRIEAEESLPALGAEFVQGKSIKLKGDAALRYLRYQDDQDPDDGIKRLTRHRTFIDAFFKEMAKRGNVLNAFRRSVREAVSKGTASGDASFRETVCTDLSMNQLTTLFERLCSYESMPAVCPPGDFTGSGALAEYNMSEASLWENVKSVFCQESA